MGAESRANNEHRERQRAVIGALMNSTLDVVEEGAQRVGVDIDQVSVTFSVRDEDGSRLLVTANAGEAIDDPADEVILMLRALEAIGDKYGIPRITMAECLLGKDAEIKLAPGRPKRTTPPEQRPSRSIGQRKRRRHGR